MTLAQPLLDQNAIRRRGVGVRGVNRAKAFPGYTLFAPLTGNGEVYLVDLAGRVVHQWTLPYRPGLYGYLLPSGNLFYGGKVPETRERFQLWSLFKGGVVLEVDWDGRIVWQLEHPDHHHDARRLRNGNALLLCVETVPAELVGRIRGGIPGTEAGGAIYADVVYEVTSAGAVVWEWHAWDHLDPVRHIITAQDQRHEWSHGNTVGELADGSIIVSFRNISTVVIVDRQTGRIVWEVGHDVLAQQHHPTELPNGNILIFDNGAHRSSAALSYSRVIEVDRASRQVVWEYTDDPPHGFYSAYISGAQRLPNGNTLITEGATGRIFEVTQDNELVWEFVNPHFAPWLSSGPVALPGRGEQNAVFRAFRYSPDEVPRVRR